MSTNNAAPWNTLSDDERARIYQDASLRIHDIDWYRFHGIDPRPTASLGTSYWQSTLTPGDVEQGLLRHARMARRSAQQGEPAAH